MKILLAEDQEDTAMVYKAALGDNGHVVVHTTNGEDCLKVYHNGLQVATLHSNPKEFIQPFDAVILDYTMPKDEWIRSCKRDFGSQSTPEDNICFRISSRQVVRIRTSAKPYSRNTEQAV
jgi:CheY-like chemotaxis protein